MTDDTEPEAISDDGSYEAAPATPVETPSTPVVPPVADVPVATPAVAAPSLEERTSVGDILERTARGWIARLHYGGAQRLHGEGATIDHALKEAGK